MNIAVIGGGFTGLTAGYELLKAGHRVTVFEKENYLGGLAAGFSQPGWDWHLEKAYHHFFTNDDAIIGLIKELGLEKELLTIRPITATLWKDTMYQLDSPLSLLQFPGLPMTDRLRTGIMAAFFKVLPFWQPLESWTTRSVVETIGGRAAWRTIWEPLMKGKFGPYADRVAASWFWARIKKRTPALCYIDGGFQTLVNTLAAVIKKQGGKILTNTVVDSVSQRNFTFYILHSTFDKVLLTVPTPLINKLIPQLSTTNYQLPTDIPHLHAHVLILETKEPILKDVYWLNVTDRRYPFLIVGAHTNFVNKKHYGGHHITYLGNYLPDGHPMLSWPKEKVLKKFLPFIKRLNPTIHYPLSTIHSFLFIGPFAQPVHELHYSRRAPKFETPMKGLCIANMDSIYPWDRGTNYAVELGEKAAKFILSSMGS